MPIRHFLRRDYLHNLFYIKFLLFVSLIHQIRILVIYMSDLEISKILYLENPSGLST